MAYLTQTTLSLDETKDIIAALKKKFPNIKGPRGAGYLLCDGEPAGRGEASRFRGGPAAGGGFGEQFELQPPGGSGAQLGTNAHLIDSCNNIEPEWLEGVKTIALTAGASAPECLVEEVVKFLREQGFRQRAGTGSDAGKRALRLAAGDRGGDCRLRRNRRVVQAADSVGA